jgi:hypothetical protein
MSNLRGRLEEKRETKDERGIRRIIAAEPFYNRRVKRVILFLKPDP